MSPASATVSFMCLAIIGSGCTQRQPTGVVASLPADRASALRKLDMFAGAWTLSGTIHGPGDRPEAAFTGSSEVKWDGELLVARGTVNVNGVESTAIAIITFDPVAGVYRTVSVSPDGSVGTATGRFDANEPTMRGRIESIGPHGAMIWEGEVRFSDPDTKIEHWVGRTTASAKDRVEIRKIEKRKQ